MSRIQPEFLGADPSSRSRAADVLVREEPEDEEDEEDDGNEEEDDGNEEDDEDKEGRRRLLKSVKELSGYLSRVARSIA
jgi:TATA-binding protein-associated factor Taf7